MRSPTSLRARLTWLLLAAIVVMAALLAFVAYHSARSEADEIFDYHMQQMALSLRTGLPLPGRMGLPDSTPEAHGAEEEFDFLVQVWSSEGLTLFQSAPAALPQRAVMGFSNLKAQGRAYRVFSMASRGQVIQVAQDMAARSEMAGTLALRTVAPIAIMAPSLMLLVWWLIGSSLAPVDRVRRQVASRQPDDLTPVGETGLPDEIRPLVHELNLLFGRVSRAFEAQQRFVADAAHELRTPLAALKLQALGLHRAANDRDRETAVRRLTDGIDRASRLVEQLLALARQQSLPASNGGPAPVALTDVVREVIVELEPRAHARRIDLGLLPSQDLPILGHIDGIRILLRNLVDNAIKHTPEGSAIDVSVQRGSDGINVSVEDNGPGIPPQSQARVFDRFYRMPGQASEGSGLGLAIAKEVVDMHRGRIELDRSEKLGGLRVVVMFPAVLDGAMAGEGSVSRAHPPVLSRP